MLSYLAMTPSALKLRRSIESYGRISGSQAMRKTICPRPGPTLMITLQGSYRVNSRRIPACTVMGIREESIQVESENTRTERVYVRFTPTGLRRFSCLPACRIANRIVRAGEVFPPDELRALVGALRAARDFDAEREALDSFFERLQTDAEPVEEALREVTDALCSDTGLSLKTALREIPASLRQVERLFNRSVGVSPRSFLRIARFEQAKQGILERNGKSLTDVALDAGYYDQAHFGREFRRLGSMAPGSYSFCPPSLSAPARPALTAASAAGDPRP